MIKIFLAVKNPFARDNSQGFDWNKTISLTKNKTLEIQLWKSSPYHLISFGLDLSWRGSDHAGPELSVELLGFDFTIKIYDNRHWDYKLGTWQRKV
jgi:hypothetical protein